MYVCAAGTFAINQNSVPPNPVRIYAINGSLLHEVASGHTSIVWGIHGNEEAAFTAGGDSRSTKILYVNGSLAYSRGTQGGAGAVRASQTWVFVGVATSVIRQYLASNHSLVRSLTAQADSISNENGMDIQGSFLYTASSDRNVRRWWTDNGSAAGSWVAHVGARTVSAYGDSLFVGVRTAPFCVYWFNASLSGSDAIAEFRGLSALDRTQVADNELFVGDSAKVVKFQIAVPAPAPPGRSYYRVNSAITGGSLVIQNTATGVSESACAQLCNSYAATCTMYTLIPVTGACTTFTGYGNAVAAPVGTTVYGVYYDPAYPPFALMQPSTSLSVRALSTVVSGSSLTLDPASTWPLVFVCVKNNTAGINNYYVLGTRMGLDADASGTLTRFLENTDNRAAVTSVSWRTLLWENFGYRLESDLKLGNALQATATTGPITLAPTSVAAAPAQAWHPVSLSSSMENALTLPSAFQLTTLVDGSTMFWTATLGAPMIVTTSQNSSGLRFIVINLDAGSGAFNLFVPLLNQCVGRSG
jgi:hypothetical protein